MSNFFNWFGSIILSIIFDIFHILHNTFYNDCLGQQSHALCVVHQLTSWHVYPATQLMLIINCNFTFSSTFFFFNFSIGIVSRNSIQEFHFVIIYCYCMKKKDTFLNSIILLKYVKAVFLYQFTHSLNQIRLKSKTILMKVFWIMPHISQYINRELTCHTVFEYLSVSVCQILGWKNNILYHYT